MPITNSSATIARNSSPRFCPSSTTKRGRSSARTAGARTSSSAGRLQRHHVEEERVSNIPGHPHASNYDASSRCCFDRPSRNTLQPQSPRRTVCRQTGGNRQSASGAASSVKVILKEWDVPTPNSTRTIQHCPPTARSGIPDRDRTRWVA